LAKSLHQRPKVRESLPSIVEAARDRKQRGSISTDWPFSEGVQEREGGLHAMPIVTSQADEGLVRQAGVLRSKRRILHVIPPVPVME
jgi:hypothetical protein